MIKKRKKTIFFYLGTSHSVSLKNLPNVLWNQFHIHPFTCIRCTVSLPGRKRKIQILQGSRNIAQPHLRLQSQIWVDWLVCRFCQKNVSPLPLSLYLSFWLLLSSSPSLRVSWNAGRRARKACLCVGGLSASFSFQARAHTAPSFPC